MTAKTLKTGLIAGILVLACAVSARAGSFTLTQPSYPDLSGQFVSISYNHTTGILTACGFVNALSTDPTDSFPATGKVPQSNSSRSRITLRYLSPCATFLCQQFARDAFACPAALSFRATFLTRW